MSHEYRERETKFDAEPTFALPDLSRRLPPDGTLEHATIRLESVYFDTAHHDLLASGVTLRSRTGTDDTGWQLKVPDGDARIEFRLDPTDSTVRVPAELTALTAGLRRGRPLKKVATLRTERQVTRLLTGAGDLLAEIADDSVTSAAVSSAASSSAASNIAVNTAAANNTAVNTAAANNAAANNTETATGTGPATGSGAVLDQWREIEAELGPSGDENLLAKLTRSLIKAGATPSESPNKLARAVGPVPSAATRGRSARSVISSYLADQDAALLAGDFGLRRQQFDLIHPTRVATRRLRSTLRVFTSFFDADRASTLDIELSWYAGLLGEVRDRQVQRERMTAALAELPDELILGPVAATIESHLLSEQVRHQATLLKAMSSRRYFELLQEIERWLTDPPFTGKAGGKAGRKAEEKAGKSKPLKKALATGERKVKKHLKAGLGPNGDDEQLHKARKAIKRARYAAELAEPALGRKKSKHAVDKYKDLQQELGDHQDSVVAAELLRRLGAAAGTRTGENGFTYGILYAKEQAVATATRQALRAK